MAVLELKRRKEVLRFAAALLAAGIGFLLIVEGVSRYINDHPDNAATPWIAAVPIFALMLVLVLAMRSLKRMDELARKIHVDAMAFAYLCSLFVLCSAGFLALAGVATLSLDWIAPAMVVCWNIGVVIAVVRYR